MDETNNKEIPNSESNELKNNLSKHFENKKDLPLRKKKKNVFLRLSITLFVIAIMLIAIFFLIYFFFIKGNNSVEKKQEETTPEEIINEPKVDKKIYENQDEDGDGLTTVQELELGTKVNAIDSDYDGIPDGWEVVYNLDPLEYNDALEDNDEDKLTNIEEYKYGTDPNNPDTDGDGYSDGDEVSNGFNPSGAGKLK